LLREYGVSPQIVVLTIVRNVQFVKCDTRDWDQQVNMFKKAKANSPAKSCDIVIANAGVSGPDEIFASSGLEGNFEHTPTDLANTSSGH